MPARVRPLEYLPPAASPSVADRARSVCLSSPRHLLLCPSRMHGYLPISTQEMSSDPDTAQVRYVLNSQHSLSARMRTYISIRTGADADLSLFAHQTPLSRYLSTSMSGLKSIFLSVLSSSVDVTASVESARLEYEHTRYSHARI